VTRGLKYTHFTVSLDSVQRLAIATAVNIDGALLVDVDRGNDWRFDTRIPEEEQTGTFEASRPSCPRHNSSTSWTSTERERTPQQSWPNFSTSLAQLSTEQSNGRKAQQLENKADKQPANGYQLDPRN
jgi:hypothetical protein